MRTSYIFAITLALIMVSSLAGAVGASGPKPSELVKVQPLPGIFPMSGATHDSMFAVEAWLDPIGPYQPWEIPNFGKMASYKIYTVQNDTETIAKHLIAFRDAPVAPLESVNIG